MILRILTCITTMTLLIAGAVAIPPAAQAQTYSVLYTFKGGADGAQPYAGVIRDGAGNLYGTTTGGGDLSCLTGFGCGVVFKLDMSGNETVVHTFVRGDGDSPYAGLIGDAHGNVYGTTQTGGASGVGTVFKLDKTGKETVLYSFSRVPPDGENPLARLVRDSAGNLYGTTVNGGNSNSGAVFKVDTTGKETVLASPEVYPVAGLVRDSAGNLYGTTLGVHNPPGTVFKLDPNGMLTVLHSFTGGADGQNPYAGLLRDAAGNLYGTTSAGGTGRSGIVFKLDTAGKETVLYSFTGGADGRSPYSGLVGDGKGNLYGTTFNGGNTGCGGAGCGTVYKLDMTGKETVLYSFTGGADGAFPYAGLIRDSAGNFYGTTINGGDLSCAPNNGFGCGVVFKISFP